MTSLPIQLSAAYAADNVTLQLRWHHQAQFIGYYIAEQKGFYEREGISVTIKPGGPGIIPWREVTSGRADFAVDNTNILSAYLFGEPIVALASIFQHSPSVLLAKRSDEIISAADLKGKRVMMLAEDPELLLLLKRSGISESDIQLIATSTNFQDLITDRVDVFNAYLTNEPFILEELNIPYTLLKPIDKGVDFYSDILFTSKKIAISSSLPDRFLKASLKGWEYALKHPEESIQLIKDTYPVNKTLEHLRYELSLIHGLVKPSSLPIGTMSTERWNHIATMITEAGIVRSKRDLDSFIYHKETSFDWETWLPWIYTAAVLIIALSILASYLLALNQKLKREILSRIETEKQLQHMATHDTLTELLNRSAITSHLDKIVKKARRYQRTPVLIYVDLDGFKHINDTAGHTTGDKALIRFSKRTQSLLRESDIFGRLGGDEFVILLDDSNRETAIKLAKKVLQSMDTPYVFTTGTFQMSVSIGIAVYENSNETPDQFLIRADKAMYRIKHDGKSGISIAAPFKQKETSIE